MLMNDILCDLRMGSENNFYRNEITIFKHADGEIPLPDDARNG